MSGDVVGRRADVRAIVLGALVLVGAGTVAAAVASRGSPTALDSNRPHTVPRCPMPRTNGL